MSAVDELRIRPPAERHGGSGGDPAAAGGSLDLLRAEGERLLAAGDEVVHRVLSGDSEGYLRDVRQHPGE